MRTTGLSIRAAVVIGFAVILGLWLFAWTELSLRISEAQGRAAAINARYLSAQEALTTLRAQVLIASVALRDALLDPDPQNINVYRRQLEESHDRLQELLMRYVPVSDSPVEREQFARLSAEVGAYSETMIELLASDRRQWLSEARNLLRLQVTPRRDLVLAVSETVQTVNQTTYMERQSEIAGVYRSVQRELWQLLGLALAIGVAVAIFAVVYAGRLERSLRSQMSKDFALTRELQDLSARLVTVQEQERRHIARELHDEIGQALTAIKMELAFAQGSIENVTGPTGVLEDARTITDRALNQVRDLSYLLHSAALDEFGLVPAVESYVKSFSRRHGIPVEILHDGMGVRLAGETETAAYRIIQEALTNVARHSRATGCHVHLTRLPEMLRILIEDNGSGFNPRARSMERSGLGLIGIRERASHLQGIVSIDSAPGQGTRLLAQLPVRRTADAPELGGLAESAAVPG